MASEATSSSTASQHTPFICCDSIFDKISARAVSDYAIHSQQGVSPSGPQLPAQRTPTIVVSPAEKEGILSASPLVIQVTDRQQMHHLPGIPSTHTDTRERYFGTIVSGEGTKIADWGKIKTDESELRNRGLKNNFTGTLFYHLDCPTHERKFTYSVWMR
jgi:hypothetical protein